MNDTRKDSLTLAIQACQPGTASSAIVDVAHYFLAYLEGTGGIADAVTETADEAPLPNAPAAPETPPAGKPDKPPTKKACSEAAVELGKEKGRDVLKAVLQTFDVTKVPELAEEHRAPFLMAVEEAMEAEPGEEPQPKEPEPKPPVATFEDIKTAITNLAQAGKQPEIIEALTSLGAQKASDLGAEKYDELAALLAAIQV